MLQHKVSLNCGKEEPDNEVLMWATTALENRLQSTEPGLGLSSTREGIISKITMSPQ